MQLWFLKRPWTKNTEKLPILKMVIHNPDTTTTQETKKKRGRMWNKNILCACSKKITVFHLAGGGHNTNRFDIAHGDSDYMVVNFLIASHLLKRLNYLYRSLVIVEEEKKWYLLIVVTWSRWRRQVLVFSYSGHLL